MFIKGLKDEVFQDYKKPSMLVAFSSCTWKCGNEFCQNCGLAESPNFQVTPRAICERYLSNPITEALICGGLEPFDDISGLLALISCLRRQYKCQDDIVIYTGYTEAELESGYNEVYSDSALVKKEWQTIKNSKNIIVKFGRFIPNQEKHFDEVLGVNLASPNQYAKEFK